MPWPSNNLYVALDTGAYGSGTSCGKCVSLTGTTGVTAVLRVVDQCPANSNAMWCKTAHLDLSPQAYSMVEPGQPGAIDNSPGVPTGGLPGPVNWHFVPCPVTGGIVYDFASSNSFYLAMVIENARYGIKSVSYRAAGGSSWTAMSPPTNNVNADGSTVGGVNNDAHWKVTSSPPNPIDIMVTDEWGQVIIDTNVRWGSSQITSPSGAQFAQCN